MIKARFSGLLFLFLLLGGGLASQNDLFHAVYPIGDNPSVGYKTSMVPDIENIVFEANPVLRMPFYNNIRERLMSRRDSTASTLFINFRPQIRMYTDASLPIKMPSYKIGVLGYQQMYRISQSKITDEGSKDQFFSFSVETGHYSNGQPNCALSPHIADGTEACDSLYSMIDDHSKLSDLINRQSGNFSTNYTELRVKYHHILALDDNYIPTSSFSIELGYNRYHDRLLYVFDIGGYSDNDIELYGRNRFYLDLEYMSSFNKQSGLIDWIKLDRYTIKLRSKYISKPHPSVNPFRGDLCFTTYFPNNLGLFISTIYGHDNYNFRFVDSGFQIFTGLTFDVFPPIQIK